MNSKMRLFSTSSVIWRKSSKDWLKRHVKDEFVRKSKTEEYRARSAYKLLEMQDRHKILCASSVVVECGAAPGAWTQVLASIVGPEGRVVSCDLLPFEAVEGAVVLSNTDFTKPQSQSNILSHLGGRKIDVVLSDMSPNLSGNRVLDEEQTLNLVYIVMKFALLYSVQGGTLLTKIFHGDSTKRVVEDLRRFYRDVVYVKPAASRKDSAEVYLLARNFVGIKLKS